VRTLLGPLGGEGLRSLTSSFDDEYVRASFHVELPCGAGGQVNPPISGGMEVPDKGDSHSSADQWASPAPQLHMEAAGLKLSISFLCSTCTCLMHEWSCLDLGVTVKVPRLS